MKLERFRGALRCANLSVSHLQPFFLCSPEAPCQGKADIKIKFNFF